MDSIIIIHMCTFSSSNSQHTLPTTPEANLLGVMGISDWDFLRPPTDTSVEEDETKRPSLDDFDGEIAVFQVCTYSLNTITIISLLFTSCCAEFISTTEGKQQ